MSSFHSTRFRTYLVGRVLPLALTDDRTQHKLDGRFIEPNDDDDAGTVIDDVRKTVAPVTHDHRRG